MPRNTRTAAPDLAPVDNATPDLFQGGAPTSPPVPTETGDEQRAQPAGEAEAAVLDGMRSEMMQPAAEPEGPTPETNGPAGETKPADGETTAGHDALDALAIAEAPADIVQEFAVQVPEGPASVVGWLPVKVDLVRDDILTHATPGLLKAIVSVMQGLHTLKHDATNTHSNNYRYASIDAYMAALRPAISAAGLIVLQDLEGQEVRNGMLLASWRFIVLYLDGGYIGPVSFESAARADMGAQAFGGAQAYGLKFFLRALFLIAATEQGEDVDQQPKHTLQDDPGTRRQPPMRAPRQQQNGQQQRQAGQAPASWQANQSRNAGQAPPPDDRDIPGYVPGPPDGPEAPPVRQAPPPRADRPFATEADKLKKRLQDNAIPVSSVHARFQVDDLAKLTPAQLVEANGIMDEHEAKKRAKAEAAAGQQ